MRPGFDETETKLDLVEWLDHDPMRMITVKRCDGHWHVHAMDEQGRRGSAVMDADSANAPARAAVLKLEGLS